MPCRPAAVSNTQAARPRFARGLSLGGSEEVLERDVEERGARLREHLAARGANLAVDVQAPAAGALQPRCDRQLRVDRHGLPVAHEDPGGDRGEAIPGREQATGLVERGADEPAVRDPRSALVPLVERERGLVGVGALLRRRGQPDPVPAVAATPAGAIVVWRNLHRDDTVVTRQRVKVTAAGRYR